MVASSAAARIAVEAITQSGSEPRRLDHPWDRITTIVPPHYRIGQSYVHAAGNPYCWFPGYCSYEAKTAWLTDKAPSRKFDKFAQ